MRKLTLFSPLRGVALGGVLLLSSSLASSQDRPAAFTVDGTVALHAVMALSDAHLQKMADILALLSATDDARSGEWNRIRPRLADAARLNVPAVFWFAQSNGTYWTVERGRADSTLVNRPYFPRLLAGRPVLGELVVSMSTSQNSAIVAVPIRGPDGSVTGALGSSIFLDSLTAIRRREIGGLDAEHLFFAIGSGGLGALNSDPTLILTEPMKLGDAEMRRAFSEILASHTGVVTYDFRNSRRTVLYRKSQVTGWWYGFGSMKPPR